MSFLPSACLPILQQILIKHKEMILFDAREDLAQAQISALAARRAAIAEQLENVRTAVEAFNFSEGSLEAVRPYLEAPTLEAARELAIRAWLAAKGFNVVANIGSAIEEPAAVATLMEALAAYQDKSANFLKYWNGQQFAPIPVSDEEAQGISERAALRAESEERIEMFAYCRMICSLTNESQQRFFIKCVPADFAGRYTPLAPYVEYLESEPRRGQKMYVYRPNERRFFRSTLFAAFDEKLPASEWRPVFDRSEMLG